MDMTTYAQVLMQIKTALKDTTRLKIFTPNPEILLATYHDPKYRKIIASADLLLPDGI